MPHDARTIEAQFLAAVQARLDDARAWLRGTTFRRTVGDERERLRAMIEARGAGQRGFKLADSLCNNRRVTMTGYERRWYGFGRREVGAITASVLTSFEDALDRALTDASGRQEPLRPIGSGELAAHIEALTEASPSSHVIGVCSPSGFTDQAKRIAVKRADRTVVLVEPRGDGGWEVTGLAGPSLKRACRLFDPEGDAQRSQRIRQAIDERRVALMSEGLNAAELAADLGVGQDLVEETFRELASEDGRLGVTAGERAGILYYTSTSMKETTPMSVLDFLRRILGRSASPAEKIKELEKKQAEIDDKRREFDKNVSELADKRKGLRERYKQAGADQTEKRRLVSQIAQLEQEIKLHNEKATILTKQSQVLGRQIHNLEVAQTAKTTAMPTSEDITEAAAVAETALEELDEIYEAVRTVGSATSDQSLTEEEAAIEAELEAELAREAQQDKGPSQEPTETEAVEPTEPQRAPDARQREAD